jgi:hypothetical protein
MLQVQRIKKMIFVSNKASGIINIARTLIMQS